jgi:phosphinothricin acetyltransferase
VGRAGLNALVRPAATADLDAVAEIFAWYVKNTVATFEEIPRAAGDWEEISALLDGLGLPFLVAEVDGMIAGYA